MPERNSGMVLFINLIEDKVKMKKILQKKRIGSTHLTNVDTMVTVNVEEKRCGVFKCIYCTEVKSETTV